MTTRVTVALPVDVARMMDHTTSQTQLSNDTFQGTPDDRDMLLSYIEDAEDEFRNVADVKVRLSREGVPGTRETYEQPTYKLSGHKAAKRQFSGVFSDYNITEKTIELDNERVLPFDAAEGDELYVYNGLQGASADAWEDITDDKGEIWDILDHRSGTFVFWPTLLWEAYLGGVQGGLGGAALAGQKRVRFAITYRYGALGGSRSSTGATTLTEDITDTQTGTVGVENGGRLPGGGSGGSYILLLNDEYVDATVDTSNDEIDIVSRGVRGTEKSSHDSGDRVQYTPPTIRKAVAARAGMQLIQSGRHSAFMPDSEDAIDKNDMMERLKETWDATIAALS
jgi:hypothetical protein